MAIRKMTPIAVVGMAGQFPGATDLDVFWQNIIDKVDSTAEVSRDRWIVEPDSMVHPEPAPDKAVSKYACLIDNFRFNSQGFDLDPELLNALDPLHQLVLHTGKTAIDDLAGNSLNKERTGVILASIALPTDAASALARRIFENSFVENLFNHTVSGVPARNAGLASKLTGLPGALLARGIGLGGGSYTLDAACASSLYAVKLACDQLASYRTDAMLAGGVSRPDCLYTQVGFSQLRALSPTGCCAPFDESADGLVVGEGAGILVLKRMADALKDNDTIYGLITGIGLSNDLRGNLLAPDTEGQLRALRGAYESAGWSPGDIDLVECHGAGTPVGDHTELLSLRKLWGPSGWHSRQCAIGSVKSGIGHLLTAAGAAGTIKTLLALNHKILPPSLNFKRAPDNSPLHDSPFRVQTAAEAWHRKDKTRPRRAAVSAFGFGGINAHLLLEQWHPQTYDRQDTGPDLIKNEPSDSRVGVAVTDPIPKSAQDSAITVEALPPVAIIGMETAFGSARNLQQFQELIFKGEAIIKDRPLHRWKSFEKYAPQQFEKLTSLPGAFIGEVWIDINDFRIPPNEIRDILPQHLLMLKVAIRAMQDAGLDLNEERPRMGAVIGIDFDMEATNFQLRWNLPNWIQNWKKKYGLQVDDQDLGDWMISLQESLGPPLTATRTLGALGSMVASRIARELRLGGPSFVVSGDEASGLQALAIGLRSLQQRETDVFLAGAVDFCGDIRAIFTRAEISSFSKNGVVRPFDRHADGSLPGEGAAAVVMKRIDRAVADGDRIYAVIKATGHANAGGIDTDTPTIKAYTRALKHAFQEAHLSPSDIGYFETHGAGVPPADDVESRALHDVFKDRNEPCAIGSLKPSIGHTGATAGLAALVKSALCLYQEIIPPMVNFTTPANAIWHRQTFHIPIASQYWLRDRNDGPRRAALAAMTSDGNCAAAILEAYEGPLDRKTTRIISSERKQPLGLAPYGLFAVEGQSPAALISGLKKLDRHLTKSMQRNTPVELAARSWFESTPLQAENPCAVTLVGADIGPLKEWIDRARQSISSGGSQAVSGSAGVCYNPSPIGPAGETAFVYPGSGNHYIGMGRNIGVRWPEILRAMDASTPQLKSQMRSWAYVPQRVAWEPGWEREAYEALIGDPLNLIFGQVVHGELVTRLVKSFGIQPQAVIGYSLGESAGLFAAGVWPDRDQMLHRMLGSDLFTTQLAGPYEAARKAWSIPPHEKFEWCVAAVNRPAGAVKKIMDRWPTTRLLIVNTPEQCVIGGKKEELQAAIKKLGCDAQYLDGVVTVHCDAVAPVAKAYKDLHVFRTTPPKNIRFYSCSSGRSYRPTRDSAAASILQQALTGFDFTTTVEQAYQDGVRHFLEMGPSASCSRMISRILEKRPHLTLSACINGEDDYLTILKFIGSLIAERLPANLERLYSKDSLPTGAIELTPKDTRTQIRVVTGGKSPFPAPVPGHAKDIPAANGLQKQIAGMAAVDPAPGARLHAARTGDPMSEILGRFNKSIEKTAEAHKSFLEFSNHSARAYARTLEFQNRLLECKIQAVKEDLASADSGSEVSAPIFTREQCLEFATGAVANVLGDGFAAADTYQIRVRLPDEPLMLVDRILSIEGQPKSLGSGRIVTEHDVRPEAWYLDGGRAPVCISVEAGQADLFLCAYLGIDLAVKGLRAYRLLDASVEFHRELPQPGDVIRYEIAIDKFIRQGDTYLFLFSFEGYIGNSRLISMSNGCAGFFTEGEIRNSGGIIASEEQSQPIQDTIPDNGSPLVPFKTESYDDQTLNELRTGNLAGCFGADFKDLKLAPSLRLPGGRMKLIDRIQLIDPGAGRYGLGLIRAEADIHPDDWFLTCHFMDDMVMPGTLMYECCAHALRVFMQRLGWVSARADLCYQPVIGVKSVLKCRGPVTPETRRVVYEVEINQLGYGPEPYAIADARMYADGHYIVFFKNMSLKLSGITRPEIEAFWQKRSEKPAAQRLIDTDNVIFDRDKVIEFAVGKPSRAFGDPYVKFDEERFIARLPAPPYSFLDRITTAEPRAWMLQPDGWVEAEYDVHPDAWYFRANRTPYMPYCVLMEIALQTCGWLAAYAGSALKSQKDMRFRNLEGHGRLYQEMSADFITLQMRSRLTKVSAVEDTIIEAFDFEILHGDNLIFDGNTVFGFFTADALARQRGIPETRQNTFHPLPEAVDGSRAWVLEDKPPRTPDDPDTGTFTSSLALPARAIRMIDRIEIYLPDGGPQGLGYIRGSKQVDPDEWFFKAHFFQDPVCPGSLGIESFLQLIKLMARDRWDHLASSHRWEHLTGNGHSWVYRGQIVPDNKEITVEAIVTAIHQRPCPSMTADGYLYVDGLCIYKMENFGYRLVPA
jgi:PfaB family protein